MKTFDFSKRENKEWSNMWWENADKTNEKRFLLIGDSITNSYRSHVQNNLEGISVDMLATSKALDDAMLYKELEYMLSQYDYKLIHFNNGLHGWHLDITMYKSSYEKLIEFLKKSSGSKIILATSTPVTKINNPNEFDDKKNDIVIKRNKVVTSLGNIYSLNINDLYDKMIDRPKLRSNDGYHYNEQGCEYQGKIVAKTCNLNMMEIL